jgi:BON domain
MSKMALSRWIFPVLVVLLSAAGCRPNETVEGQAKDTKIKAQIKAKLASDVDASTLTSVEVNVTNGVVTLAGPVHSAEESQRIESTVRAVEGVKQVNNSLQVLGAQASAPAGAGAAIPVTPLPSPSPATTP